MRKLKCLVLLLAATPLVVLAVNPTSLSRAAMQLKTGMTRTQAIQLLGPATWAVLSRDGGDYKLPDSRIATELYWRNSPCNPVVVQFDIRGHVTGMDQGIAFCDKAISVMMEPPSSYSCKKSDRAKLCR